MVQFDSHPTVEYMSGTQYYDAAATGDNVFYDSETPSHLTAGNVGGMCVEIWTYNWVWAPGNACVKLQGSLWRYFNTLDTTDDLVLGY